jgi:hypothetical protein
MKSGISTALLVLVACAGAVTGIIPVDEEPVLVGPVGTTPAEPVDSVVLCDTAWTLKSVCWQVLDSVRP